MEKVVAPVVRLVESRRAENDLTQAEVALACGLTQGHYSKLAQGSHWPGRRVETALSEWLESHGGRDEYLSGAVRIASLAASIRQDCAELIRLARRRGKPDGGPGARR